MHKVISFRVMCAMAAVMVTLVSFSVQAADKRPTRVEGIAAVVDTAAISESDVSERVRLIVASSGMQPTPEVLAQVRPQVVGMLVEEAIKRQEAKRLNLSAEAADVEAALGDIATQNKMTPEDFKGMFARAGLPLRTLREQITAQILWAKVVAKKIRPQIEISESDIDSELAQLQTKVGMNEYLLSEIVLPVDRPEDAGPARTLGLKLVGQIKAQPESFPSLARQFSRAPGAAQGGLVGWVAPGALAAELDAALGMARAGDLLGPIKTVDGMHILLVREVRTRTADTLPSRDAVAQRLGLERLDRLQRRYYQDLRAAAFVDIR